MTTTPAVDTDYDDGYAEYMAAQAGWGLPDPKITCGKCTKTQGEPVKHYTVNGVRHCYAGETYVCGDYVEALSEDGPIVVSCPGVRWETPRGSECERGHSYVSMMTRHNEGWDYADCEEEAAALNKVGVSAVVATPNRYSHHV